jgi:hypothetical protein
MFGMRHYVTMPTAPSQIGDGVVCLWRPRAVDRRTNRSFMLITLRCIVLRA